MGGFEVIPEALSAAGAAMEPVGAELPTEAQTTTGPVQSAAAANLGFFVSETLGYAYTQIERAVQGAATDIRQYGKNRARVHGADLSGKPKQKISTVFPDGWTEHEINQAVRGAFYNRRPDDIATVYPVM